MDLNRILRGIAGAFVLISLILYFFNAWWLLLTTFVGLNLLQSAFTGNCPAMWVLRKLGFRALGDEERT